MASIKRNSSIGDVHAMPVEEWCVREPVDNACFEKMMEGCTACLLVVLLLLVFLYPRGQRVGLKVFRWDQAKRQLTMCTCSYYPCYPLNSNIPYHF